MGQGLKGTGSPQVILPGEYWLPDDTSAAAITAGLEGKRYEGQIVEFPDLDYSSSPAKPRSARRKRYMIVRNMMAPAVLPKQAVKLEATGDIGQVDGFTNTLAERGFPADEFLPSTGAPQYALFLVGIEGPHTCLSGIAGEDSAANFTAGAPVVALASASGDTESGAGRIGTQVFTGVSDAASGLANAKQTQNLLGHAMSAVDKTSDDEDVLVDLCIRV